MGAAVVGVRNARAIGWNRRARRRRFPATLGAAAAAFAAGSAWGQAAIIGKGADIRTMCGSKPAIVALVDGSGDNIWRRVTRVEFEEEARRCPNVVKTLYAEAGNDQQKYNGAINSMVAQGANVIVTFADYGAASLPAFRKAFKDGVAVVPYFGNAGGVAGRDYTANVRADLDEIGRAWADWVAQAIGKGRIAYLGGVAGSSSSQAFLDGLKKGLAKHPSVTLLEQEYTVTNWNPADGQRAVSGLIAKHGRIDAVVSEYGVTALAAIKAFEQAGLPVPPVATIASFNELNCKYLDPARPRPWKYYTVDGTNSAVRFALRRGLAAFQGTRNDEPLTLMPYVYADSLKGIDPKCDPNAPLDADLSAGLPRDKLYSLFKR